VSLTRSALPTPADKGYSANLPELDVDAVDASVLMITSLHVR
jgi:hypothetical protein